VKLAAATALAALALVPAAEAVGFAPAVPSGRALSQLAAAETALLSVGDDPRAERLLRAAGAARVAPQLGIWTLPGRAAAPLVGRLERLGALRSAEPSRPRDALVRFTDPLSAPDVGYHLYAVGADKAEPPGPGFPITILDSGVDLGHPDFAGRPDTFSLNRQNVSREDPDSYHGTMVASTAAAAVNGVGAEGIYPLAALRTYDLEDLTDASLIAGLARAVAAGPSVINLSIGGSTASRAEYEAIQFAIGTGSLVVAAAGNELEAGNPTLFPASYPHVLTVGATDREGNASVFSSTSLAVDVSAPGEDLPLQHPADFDPAAFDVLSGTSFAAPIVSAAAAWVRTVRGSITPTQLADLLRDSATDIGAPGFDDSTGFGLLNIPAALAAPLPALDPQEPNDEIRQVVAGGLFRLAKPLVSNRFTAGLDATEDPADFYRVSVPKNRTLTARVTPTADVAVALWGAGPTRNSTRRLAISDRAGRAVETVTWTNRGRGAAVIYLQVRLGARSTLANPRYAVALTRAPAPR
jgi:subtilisin family serine protease